MQNLVIAFLVFCAFVGAVFSLKLDSINDAPANDVSNNSEYHSLQAQRCYHCITCQGDDYKEQCEQDQKVINCSHLGGNYTCIKAHIATLSGKKQEERGCILKTQCELLKNICEQGTEEDKKQRNVTECEVACCENDGDKPCNGGFTVSINALMIMFAVLCSLKLF